jgi:hypothetical protein
MAPMISLVVILVSTSSHMLLVHVPSATRILRNQNTNQ